MNGARRAKWRPKDTISEWGGLGRRWRPRRGAARPARAALWAAAAAVAPHATHDARRSARRQSGAATAPRGSAVARSGGTQPLASLCGAAAPARGPSPLTPGPRPAPHPRPQGTLQQRVDSLQEEHARAAAANALGQTRAHVLQALLACHRVAAAMQADPRAPLDAGGCDAAAMEAAAAQLVAAVHGGGTGGGGAAADAWRRHSGVGSTTLELCNRWGNLGLPWPGPRPRRVPLRGWGFGGVAVLNATPAPARPPPPPPPPRAPSIVTWPAPFESERDFGPWWGQQVMRLAPIVNSCEVLGEELTRQVAQVRRAGGAGSLGLRAGRAARRALR
jgi:hypothetical protein